MAFFADFGGIDEVAGEFAQVVRGHFHVRAGEIEQQGVWVFFLVGGCHVELRHPFDGPGRRGEGRFGFRFCRQLKHVAKNIDEVFHGGFGSCCGGRVFDPGFEFFFEEDHVFADFAGLDAAL